MLFASSSSPSSKSGNYVSYPLRHYLDEYNDYLLHHISGKAVANVRGLFRQVLLEIVLLLAQVRDLVLVEGELLCECAHRLFQAVNLALKSSGVHRIGMGVVCYWPLSIAINLPFCIFNKLLSF